MQIRNQDFNFDVLNAADADRFQQAVNEMQAAAAAVPKAGGLGAIIRANCAAIDNFLADLLGEDYDQRLGIDTDNLRQLQAVYYEMRDACAALQNPEFRAVCGQTNGHMTVGGVEYWMSNHNRLLKEYEGCIGLKTGYTDEAGRCLVSAAERDGAVIVSVVLHDPEDWDDSAALLDWGFSALAPVALETDLSDIGIPVRSETETTLFYTVRPRESLSAALAPGERLYPVLSVRESLPETARTGDTAGMLRWVDAEGETRCWTALELDALTSPDAAASPGQSTIP